MKRFAVEMAGRATCRGHGIRVKAQEGGAEPAYKVKELHRLKISPTTATTDATEISVLVRASI